jgi:energy-coupling factor transport system permease protein
LKIISLDPRTKFIIFVFVNIMMIAGMNSLVELLCISIIFMTFFCLGALKLAVLWGISYIVLIAVMRLCIFLPGILSVITMVLACARRAFPVFFFAAGFIATTKLSEIICAMQKMRIPKGVVIPFSVAMRFFPSAQEDFSQVKDAMCLRGISLSIKNIFHRPLVVLECALVPMLLRSANIAEELSAAAVARGIENKRPRSSVWSLKFTWQDFLIISLYLLLILFSITRALLHG